MTPVTISILARGMQISFVPGEHSFSSFQVENVHWKCMCAAHKFIIKINNNKNKINLRNHEFVRKKPKWRVKGKWRRLILLLFFIIRVDFFMIRVDPSPILFYFIFYFFIRSELIRPGLAVPTFVPA